MDFIPFHKPYITDDEINEVVDTVKSGWWTTGPKVQKFEKEFNEYIGSKRSVAVSSWTAAGHLTLEAFRIKSGDEVHTGEGLKADQDFSYYKISKPQGTLLLEEE